MKYLSSFFALLWLSAYSLADGPPVDTNGIIHDSVIAIDLNPIQLMQIQSSRTVILSKKQFAKLRTPYKYQHRPISALSPFYNDCTCDQFYLIWNVKQSVSFPRSISQYYEPFSSDSTNKNGEWIWADTLQSSFLEHPQVYLGLDGEIFLRGSKIGIEQLRDTLVSASSSKDRNSRIFGISVGRPPRTSQSSIQKILEVLKKLENIALELGISMKIEG